MVYQGWRWRVSDILTQRLSQEKFRYWKEANMKLKNKLNVKITTSWYDQLFWFKLKIILLWQFCASVSLCWCELFDLQCDLFFYFLFFLSDPPAPRLGVKNMRIDEETTFSMRVAWQPVDSRNVRHYQLSYISAKGDRAEETVRQKTVCFVLPAQLGHFNSRWQFLFVL